MQSSRWETEFDYIVVGAGSAGCVLASELANTYGHRVLLIEQGIRQSHRFSLAPVSYPRLFQHPQFSCGFETVPQMALAGRRLKLPAGKGLGGSSLINAMIYIRPHAGDIEEWIKRCESLSSERSPWDTSEIASHLETIETRYGLDQGDDPIELHPGIKQLLETVAAHGETSLAPYVRTQRKGRRMTSWKTMLGHGDSERASANSMRSGLSWVTGCRVERVLWRDGVATGVQISGPKGDVGISDIRARCGVILSAGTLGSPQLLMQSGIGPKEQLHGKGECVYDSPQVGQNLHDHLVFPVVFKTSMASLPSHFSREDRSKWLADGTGPMASNIAELGAFLHRDAKQSFALAEPNAWCYPHHACAVKDLTRTTARPCVQWHITPTHYLEYPFRDSANPACSFAVTWLHPKSRGEIRWKADHSWEIDPKYLSHDSDADGLVEAVQWTRRWIQNGPLNTLFPEEILPGSKRVRDEQVHAIVSRLSNTLYHYSGSCAMSGRSESVCDPKMKVRGVDRLFVCDASVIPVTLSGNTQATVMMLGMQLAKWLGEK